MNNVAINKRPINMLGGCVLIVISMISRRGEIFCGNNIFVFHKKTIGGKLTARVIPASMYICQGIVEQVANKTFIYHDVLFRVLYNYSNYDLSETDSKVMKLVT